MAVPTVAAKRFARLPAVECVTGPSGARPYAMKVILPALLTRYRKTVPGRAVEWQDRGRQRYLHVQLDATLTSPLPLYVAFKGCIQTGWLLVPSAEVSVKLVGAVLFSTQSVSALYS